jgi:hypothetical protein
MTALALSNEALGSHVENAVLGISKTLADLRPYIEELWTRFDALEPGQTIRGCRTRKEYCANVLQRTPRAVRYMLDGGNPVSKRGETVSPAESVQLVNEVPAPVIDIVFDKLSTFSSESFLGRVPALIEKLNDGPQTPADQKTLAAIVTCLDDISEKSSLYRAQLESHPTLLNDATPMLLRGGKSASDLTAILTGFLSELTALNAFTKSVENITLDVPSRRQVETLVATLHKISRDATDRAQRLALAIEKAA